MSCVACFQAGYSAPRSTRRFTKGDYGLVAAVDALRLAHAGYQRTIDEHLVAPPLLGISTPRAAVRRVTNATPVVRRRSRYDSAILVLVFMMSSSQIYHSAGAPVSQTRESQSSVTGFLSNRIALRYDNAVAV
jgi:hypothetical protein